MWSAAPGWGRGRKRPTVPPPKIHVVEISRPIIGDKWRIRSLDGDYDEEAFPNTELREILGAAGISPLVATSTAGRLSAGLIGEKEKR